MGGINMKTPGQIFYESFIKPLHGHWMTSPILFYDTVPAPTWEELPDEVKRYCEESANEFAIASLQQAAQE